MTRKALAVASLPDDAAGSDLDEQQIQMSYVMIDLNAVILGFLDGK